MSVLTEEMSDYAGRFPPQQSAATIPGDGAWHKIVQANPLRWGLVLVLPGGGAGTVNVGIDNTISTSEGWALTAAAVLTYDWRSHPGLTTCAWFAWTTNPGGATIGVIEELAQQ